MVKFNFKFLQKVPFLNTVVFLLYFLLKMFGLKSQFQAK